MSFNTMCNPLHSLFSHSLFTETGEVEVDVDYESEGEEEEELEGEEEDEEEPELEEVRAGVVY